MLKGLLSCLTSLAFDAPKAVPPPIPDSRTPEEILGGKILKVFLDLNYVTTLAAQVTVIIDSGDDGEGFTKAIEAHMNYGARALGLDGLSSYKPIKFEGRLVGIEVKFDG